MSRQLERCPMININKRILIEALESRTPQDPRDHERSRYLDDYYDVQDEPNSVPLRPPTRHTSLQPDELALHEKLLEIAKANPPAPSESFFG